MHKQINEMVQQGKLYLYKVIYRHQKLPPYT